MKRIIVTAPYIMLKVKDSATGAVTVQEFYKDRVLPEGADPADVERLLGKGMLGTVEFPDPEPEPKPEPMKEPEKGPDAVRPAGNASRDDWAAYATGKGAPESETKPVDEGGLSRDDLRAKYGN